MTSFFFFSFILLKCFLFRLFSFYACRLSFKFVLNGMDVRHLYVILSTSQYIERLQNQFPIYGYEHCCGIVIVCIHIHIILKDSLKCNLLLAMVLCGNNTLEHISTMYCINAESVQCHEIYAFTNKTHAYTIHIDT